MNSEKPKFEFKKGILDNKLSISFLSLFIVPIILFRNGFLDLTFFSIIFVLFGNLLYFSLRNIFSIRFFEEKTEFSNVLGKKIVIPNKKITFSETYFIRKKSIINGDIQTLKLEIKLVNRKVIVYQDEEKYYESLKDYCKKNYLRVADESVDYWNYLVPSFIVILGICFFIFTQRSFRSQKQDNLEAIKKYGYVKILGTYKNYETIGKNSSDIWLHLYEYPKFDFSPIDFSQDKTKYYNLKKKGENIVIYISPNEYKKKIEKTIPLKFYDKYFGYNVITVYKVE
ncbi:hypothetical protein JSO61_005055 [Riemerella anatipestifer]|uniref:hypothetical protein n=1 Tax=Riemerella anatipestifer TaxID=34085 RepID=UPI0030BB01FF